MRNFLKYAVVATGCLSLSLGVGACDTDDEDGEGGSGVAGHGGAHAHGGDGGGGGDGGTAATIISVAGQILTHPLAGGTPVGAGVDVRVVDPLLSLQGSPDAILGSGVTDADGKFAIAGVDVSGLGIGAVLTVDDAGELYVGSTMGLCTVGECVSTTDTVGYILPTALNTQLETAVANEQLFEEGYILGMVIGADGTPISGAAASSTNADFHYLNTDLTGLSENVTTDSGAFVAIPGGITTVTVEKAGVTFSEATQSAGRSTNIVFQAFWIAE